jgi:predicted dehydrogenase
MTTNTTSSDATAVGVIGVGSMGKHHARVYEALPEANLVGVTDADPDRAAETAATYGTTVYEFEDLLEHVSAVSIAVPTRYHYEIASECLEVGVDVLIEKPIANTVREADKLIQEADEHERILQVGHIERFNPAVQTLQEFVDDLNIISINAERLGPPPGRQITDSAVLDLMIHDIDIVLSLVGASPATVSGAGVRENRHATATLTFDSNVVANLTASRVTQQKVRELEVIAEDCLVRVDYMSKEVEIHRQSRPEYLTDDEDVRYRHESIIEQPMVDSTEPLVNELSSFIESVRERSQPVVDGNDGMQALQLANHIDQFRVDNSDDVDPLGQPTSEVHLD